ncbi:MAG: heparinase II/III family protein [Myxococcota bacterium]|nr:heparinase II/III family protein [Myxococcota bacterium]
MRRLLGPLLLCSLLLPLPAGAAWEPSGLDLTRPRLLHLGGDPEALAARAVQEPYRRILLDMMRRASLADGISLDDDGITAQRFKARAAKAWAFLYAIGIAVEEGEVRPFADAAERQAAGDRARDWLLNLFPRSRLAVPPPIGGWDRDISTSEELLQWATAYDTLLGAGYAFTPAESAAIEDGIADIAEELYTDYLEGRADLHQNNHRSKSGASLMAAGIVLAHLESDPVADPSADPSADPMGRRDPANWIAYGLTQVDLIMRWALVAGDGAYAEGPFYLRFASQNLLPVLRAWHRIAKGRASDHPSLALPVSPQGPHRAVPNLWLHPLFRQSMRWQLDMTLSDGRLAAQDDGSPGRAFYFGLAPGADLESAFHWRYANARTPYEGDGNVELGPDAVAYFDASVPPAPPPGPTTRFYPEGGNAIFRSDWSEDGVVVVVQGERDVASEFGRGPDGAPVAPESHEHAEPGAFLMDAFGERLLLDPGYDNFLTRYLTSEPEHHSMITVDGRGPVVYLAASSFWLANPDERPPADGHASLFDLIDTDFVDTATVLSRYGGTVEDLTQDSVRFERRFLFADERYLLIADRVDTEQGRPRDLRWYFQGNAGEDAGGTVTMLPTGARWERPKARVDVAMASDGAPLTFGSQPSNHVTDAKDVIQHTALTADATTGAATTLALAYPTPTSQPPPQVTPIDLPGGAGILLDDPASDRKVAAFHRIPDDSLFAIVTSNGQSSLVTDGAIGLIDTHTDGTVRFAWVEDATRIFINGPMYLSSEERTTLGMAWDGERIEIFHGGDESAVPFGTRRAFTPGSFSIQGACDLEQQGIAELTLSRERRVILAGPGPTLPAADPGPEVRGDVGEWITLDGSGSCDADGRTLWPTWKLVSAPPGSDWQLSDAASFSPKLHLDRPGPYRVELTVRAGDDVSRPQQVLILAGDPCEGSYDEDRDGFIDSDDADCDAGIEAAGSPLCGLGFELVLVLPALAARRRRNR